MKEIPIIFNNSWFEELNKKITDDGPWCSYNTFKLATAAGKRQVVPDFSHIMVTNYISSFTPLGYQLQSTQKVIEQMNGKAILADEVGLGKTIVSGLILKEYIIRGLVTRVLILVPAALITQWLQELQEKFHISAVAYKKNMRWQDYNVIVATLDLAKRNIHADEIIKLDYDMLIVDEAHKLKNHQTQNYKFVKKIKKKYCLLLTATPIQNKIEEIFSLVSLLKPGLLGNYEQFMRRFSSKKITTDDRDILHRLLYQVMIRNSRKSSNVTWTSRKVETVFIDLSSEERNLYEAVSRLRHHAFSTLLLQKEACSSKEAVFFTLKKIGEESLIPYVEKVNCNSKAEKLVELIKGINSKILIFTEYRATQLYLQWFLKQHNILAIPFRGGFKNSRKEWMKMLFEKQAQVMIATEAGAEGINLQFCHNVVNFDLPWNPMKVEQRIGRVHRYGQQEDVNIYHLVVKNTIEERIMRLLYDKISLFEKVVGELDDILVKLDINDFDRHVTEIIANSRTEGEMQVKMDNLINILRLSNEEFVEDKINGTRGDSPVFG